MTDDPETWASRAKTPDGERYVLYLFVTGATPRSTRAIQNLSSLCEKHLKGRYELKVVDLYQEPDQAAGEGIIAAPTLIKKLPLPLRRFIGDLSDAEQLLIGLEIRSKAKEGGTDASDPAPNTR
jgi:circadian clock protein KaiB